MPGLVFASEIDRTGQHDASKVFLPYSREFAAVYGYGTPVRLNEHGEKEKHPRTVLYSSLEAARGLDVIAYFGHEVKTGMPSAKVRWQHLRELRDRIQKASNGPCKVILYACSTGEPGYFASTLQMLLGPAFTVFGHTIPGHSTTNPYVTRFPAAAGSEFIIAPKSRLWKQWYCSLKCDKNSNLWREFPFMTQMAIEERLSRFDCHSLKSHSEHCAYHHSAPKPKVQVPAGAHR